jgi:uncharacterized protein YeeX (DUF496 family)
MTCNNCKDEVKDYEVKLKEKDESINNLQCKCCEMESEKENLRNVWDKEMAGMKEDYENRLADTILSVH